MIELKLKVIWTEMVAMSTVFAGVSYVGCMGIGLERKIPSQFDQAANCYDRLRPLRFDTLKVLVEKPWL